MISELSDNDILDYLMTSDFNEDLSPKDLKYLLNKYRYFYRILNGRLERTNIDIKTDIDRMDNIIEELNKDKIIKQLDINNKEVLIHNLENRKLPLKERITGKIIKKDEI